MTSDSFAPFVARFGDRAAQIEPLLRGFDAARVRMLEDVMDTHFEAITWGMSEIVNFGRAEGELKEKMLECHRSQLTRSKDKDFSPLRKSTMPCTPSRRPS